MSSKQPRLDQFEKRARKAGYRYIAGVDEAGRGPLAGPVVAAACILPEGIRIPGINDSKKLTPDERQKLYSFLKSHPDVLLGVGVVDALIIDQINILQATLRAMAAAILQLQQKPDFVLVDGNKLPPIEIPAQAIVEGDTKSQSIMAAAIIAKVTRDQLMMEYHQLWPAYGFAQHKGYPTPHHQKILEEIGPCPIHRMSFTPVSKARR